MCEVRIDVAKHYYRIRLSLSCIIILEKILVLRMVFENSGESVGRNRYLKKDVLKK